MLFYLMKEFRSMCLIMTFHVDLFFLNWPKFAKIGPFKAGFKSYKMRRVNLSYRPGH